jgi:hypothetical protein
MRLAFLDTCVPVPMAMPISAALIAGASFTPSPAMATTSPFFLRVWTSSTLCSGATRPTTPMSSMRASRSSSLSAAAVARAFPWLPLARRSRADDGGLAPVNVVPDADADCAGKIGQARIDDDLAVVTNHHREARPVEPGLVWQTPSGLTLDRVEPERHSEPRHHVAQLQHSAVTLRGNDPKQLEARLLLPRPRGGTRS